jgi:hypothetical protein
MLTSSVVDRWFEPQSGQTKDYEIGICYFSAKHNMTMNMILVHSEIASKLMSDTERIKGSPEPTSLTWIFMHGFEFKNF